MDSKPMAVQDFIAEGAAFLTALLQGVCLYSPATANVTGAKNGSDSMVQFTFNMANADINELPTEVGMSLDRITGRIGATHADLNGNPFLTTAVLPVPIAHQLASYRKYLLDFLSTDEIRTLGIGAADNKIGLGLGNIAREPAL